MQERHARVADTGARLLVDQAQPSRAHALIAANRDLLESLAQGLLEREVLEREDISVIVASHSGVLAAAEAIEPPPSATS